MKYVLVTTEYRGVFAGEQDTYDEEARRITLKNVRCAIYWATKGGFLELADVGPNESSKIGSVAPRVELHGVTSVVDCTEKAEKAWRSA